MPALLPFVPSVPLYRFSTSLEGVQYIIDTHWNGREGKWYIDLLSDDEVMIRAGVPLVLGAILGHGYSNPDWPPGAFVVADLAHTGVDAGFSDLGARVAVYYLTAAEVAELGV